MPIADRLKEIRTQKGLTQGQLAERAGIELAQISRIERGKSEPKLETIQKLINALGCSADYLINEGNINSLDDWMRLALQEAGALSPRDKATIIETIERFNKAQKLDDLVNEMRPASDEEKAHKRAQSNSRSEYMEGLIADEEGF